MPQVLAKLLIAFAASQWLYAELLLCHPEADQWAKRAASVLTIPTHDKWPGDTGARLRKAVEGVIGGGAARADAPVSQPAATNGKSNRLAEVEMLMLHPASSLGSAPSSVSGELAALQARDEPQYLPLFENTNGKPFYWGLEMFDNDRLARS